MKDFTQSQLEEGPLPNYDATYLINFCLSHLYEDTIHTIDQNVCNNRLTFEELIGALLVARKEITELEKENSELSDAVCEESS